MATKTYTIKVPAKHAEDWWGRFGEEGQIVASSARTVTLCLDEEALCNLISDAYYYAENMSGWWTDGVDYASAAKRLIRAIDRIGIKYHRDGYGIRLIEED